MAETLPYEHDGTRLCGLVEQPRQPNGRAIMLLHEINGIGDNVRQRARQLAGLGYLAFVADLYGDGRAYEGDAAREQMDRLVADTSRFRARVRAGFDHMLGLAGVKPERSAAIGYCFGGLAALELARSGAPAAAVVSFHGLFTTARRARQGEIGARILACTGALDPLVPPADVAAFQHEMMEARADWQLIVYGRALHAFTNRNVIGSADPRLAYDACADSQSWAAAMLFLDEALA
jgi:dienelactone hydrolase